MRNTEAPCQLPALSSQCRVQIYFEKWAALQQRCFLRWDVHQEKQVAEQRILILKSEWIRSVPVLEQKVTKKPWLLGHRVRSWRQIILLFYCCRKVGFTANTELSWGLSLFQESQLYQLPEPRPNRQTRWWDFKSKNFSVTYSQNPQIYGKQVTPMHA